jgi:hypothetical protein
VVGEVSLPANEWDKIWVSSNQAQKLVNQGAYELTQIHYGLYIIDI